MPATTSKKLKKRQADIVPDTSSPDYNLGQNIWRLFHFLAQLFFTTSEAELDYFHMKVGVRVAHELPNNLRLRILGN